MPRVSTLKDWVESYFTNQHVNPEIRKEVTTALKYAGFGAGVPVSQNSLALKIAHRLVNAGTMSVQAEARVAAVVSANGACPRCGSAMVDAALSNGAATRYCSNTRCRVTCWVE